MNNYSPFQKPIDAITLADIATLRNVPEGWYVEYKREFKNASSTAKSLSAFANSYGGWLFYGVEEGADGRHMAAAFPGITVGSLSSIEQSIAQAASTHVSPVPFFERRRILGPDDNIGLAADRAIVVVHVPQGSNAPYVHSSGRVYRRVADRSDPTHETDRHFLDLLWQRGRTARRSFSKFVKKKAQISEAEQDNSYLKVMLFVDPWGDRGIRSELEFDDFSKLMADGTPETGGLPFDNTFTTSNGFVSRQVQSNDSDRLLFSWRFYFDCTSVITVPLRVGQMSPNQPARFLVGYEQCTEFTSLLRKNNLKSSWLIDLCQLFPLLAAIATRKRHLLELDNISLPLFFKTNIIGTWRRVPFLDLQEYIQFCEAHGIPVIQEDRCFVPSGTEPDTCLELVDREETDVSRHTARLLDGYLMFLIVCNALGLPLTIFKSSDSADDDWFDRMMAMNERAKKATML